MQNGTATRGETKARGQSRPIEMNGFDVIKFQPNLAFIDYDVVDGVRLVHCGIFFFKVIGYPSQANQSLAAKAASPSNDESAKIEAVGNVTK